MMDFETCKELAVGNASMLKDCISEETLAGGIAGGLVAVLVSLGLFILFIFIVAIYIYHAISWQTIAKKLKYKRAWFAWVPFLSTAMRLQMAGFRWELTFLYLIPVLGWIAVWVLLIISHWRIFKKRKYPGWFSLAVLIPQIGEILYLVIIGFVAWDDRRKQLFR